MGDGKGAGALALSTCTEAESEMAIVLEKAKVAKSDGPFGIVAGDQLVAVLQLPVGGVGKPGRAARLRVGREAEAEESGDSQEDGQTVNR
jgi:hypothetical protein